MRDVRCVMCPTLSHTVAVRRGTPRMMCTKEPSSDEDSIDEDTALLSKQRPARFRKRSQVVFSSSNCSSSSSSDSDGDSVAQSGFTVGTSFAAKTIDEAKLWLLSNFARTHGGHVYCRNSWLVSLEVYIIRLTLVLQPSKGARRMP